MTNIEKCQLRIKLIIKLNIARRHIKQEKLIITYLHQFISVFTRKVYFLINNLSKEEFTVRKYKRKMNIHESLMGNEENSIGKNQKILLKSQDGDVSIIPSNSAMNITQSFTCIKHYKYFNAAVLILSALFNSMIGVSFATINHQVTQYYGVSTQLVSFCALQFLFINPIISVFANYILDNKGLKLGVSINCVLNIIGVTFRLFINQGFAFVIIGNAFSAMGNIFIVNCPARFSAVWFKPSQRIIITSLIAFANAVSGQIGAILSPYFVSNDLTPEEGRNSIRGLIFFQSILISSVMLLNLIFFKGLPAKKKNPLDVKFDALEISPQTSQEKVSAQQSQISSNQTHSQQTLPPHFIPISSQKLQANSHHLQKKHKHERYINQIKTLFTTKDYILSLISFSLIACVLNCFATNVELYILPFGFSSNDAGNLTLVSVVTGLAGAILSSLIIKKLKKFKYVILAEIMLSIVASSLIIISLVAQIFWLLYFSIGLFTMLLYPLFPAIGEYCCQFMHPIRESTVAGFLFGIAQLISFGVGMAQAVILQKKTKENVIICLAINVSCYVIALITMFFTKQRLKRLFQSQSQ